MAAPMDYGKIVAALVGGEPLSYAIKEDGTLIVIGPTGQKFRFGREKWENLVESDQGPSSTLRSPSRALRSGEKMETSKDMTQKTKKLPQKVAKTLRGYPGVAEDGSHAEENSMAEDDNTAKEARKTERGSKPSGKNKPSEK